MPRAGGLSRCQPRTGASGSSPAALCVLLSGLCFCSVAHCGTGARRGCRRGVVTPPYRILLPPPPGPFTCSPARPGPFCGDRASGGEASPPPPVRPCGQPRAGGLCGCGDPTGRLGACGPFVRRPGVRPVRSVCAASPPLYVTPRRRRAVVSAVKINRERGTSKGSAF